mmetsp:Transcript_15793/g.36433  ORF Transcript_15793/g.36433 Transcript_15793/m.36433 type:complete len:554 (-) Transcript_15793:800-2461(-)
MFVPLLDLEAREAAVGVELSRSDGEEGGEDREAPHLHGAVANLLVGGREAGEQPVCAEGRVLPCLVHVCRGASHLLGQVEGGLGEVEGGGHRLGVGALLGGLGPVRLEGEHAREEGLLGPHHHDVGYRVKVLLEHILKLLGLYRPPVRQLQYPLVVLVLALRRRRRRRGRLGGCWGVGLPLGGGAGLGRGGLLGRGGGALGLGRGKLHAGKALLLDAGATVDEFVCDGICDGRDGVLIILGLLEDSPPPLELGLVAFHRKALLNQRRPQHGVAHGLRVDAGAGAEAAGVVGEDGGGGLGGFDLEAGAWEASCGGHLEANVTHDTEGVVATRRLEDHVDGGVLGADQELVHPALKVVHFANHALALNRLEDVSVPDPLLARRRRVHHPTHVDVDRATVRGKREPYRVELLLPSLEVNEELALDDSFVLLVRVVLLEDKLGVRLGDALLDDLAPVVDGQLVHLAHREDQGVHVGPVPNLKQHVARPDLAVLRRGPAALHMVHDNLAILVLQEGDAARHPREVGDVLLVGGHVARGELDGGLKEGGGDVDRVLVDD